MPPRSVLATVQRSDSAVLGQAGAAGGRPIGSLHGRCGSPGRTAVIEWSDEQQMVRAAVRDFIEKELVPHHRELEHGDMPPYDILRKLFSTFGLDAMARARFDRHLAATGRRPRATARPPTSG